MEGGTAVFGRQFFRAVWIGIALATIGCGGSSSGVPGVPKGPTQPPGSAGVITEYPMAKANAFPYGISAGPDGNVWFVELLFGVGKITPAGAVTEYAVPGSPQLEGITNGPDGNLWFASVNNGTVGKVIPGGTVTQYAVGGGVADLIQYITAGPDGNLWFGGSGFIGKITTSGAITKFTFKSKNGDTPSVIGITKGPDGNVWFVDANGFIGKITTGGVVTEYAIPTPSTQPWARK